MLDGSISFLKSAYVLPSRVNDFGGGKSGKVLFGVVDNQIEHHFNHIRGAREWSDPEARITYIKNNKPIELRGSWLYGGPLFYHFGHFMSESLSRLWAFSELKDKLEGIIFIVPPYMKQPSLTSFMRDALSLLGIDSNKVFLTNKFLEVEDLVVPEQGTVLGEGMKPWFNDKLKRNKNISVNEIGAGTLFLSRRNYVTNGRVMGMNYYEALMAKANVNIICPEELSLKSQVIEIMKHDTLIFEEGSSLHILEIIPHLEKKIVLIKRREGDSYLETLIKQKAPYTNQYSYISESPMIFNNDQRHNVCSRLSDPKDFFDFLKGLNVISGSEVFSSQEFFIEEENDIKNYLLEKIRNDNEYFR